jgi:hypothetical protein
MEGAGKVEAAAQRQFQGRKSQVVEWEEFKFHRCVMGQEKCSDDIIDLQSDLGWSVTIAPLLHYWRQCQLAAVARHYRQLFRSQGVRQWELAVVHLAQYWHFWVQGSAPCDLTLLASNHQSTFHCRSNSYLDCSRFEIDSFGITRRIECRS